jgi:hypothetical protein
VIVEEEIVLLQTPPKCKLSEKKASLNGNKRPFNLDQPDLDKEII